MLKQEGKLFGKISIIDLLAVIALVVLIAGLVFRFSGNQAVTVETGRPMECVLRVEGIRQDTVNALEKGGAVYEIDTKEYIGEIVAVTQEPHTTLLEMANGERKRVEVEERYDALVTVSFTGNVSEEGYYTDSNRQMSVGGQLGMNAKFAQCWGNILEVRLAEEK